MPGGVVYPPVSLFYKHPSDQLREECAAFRARSLLHHCNENAFDLTGLHKALSESGKFQQLSLAQNEQAYQALISIAVLDEESGKEIGNAALSGATLMMLPIVMEKTLRAEVVVTWAELPIKRYDYTLPLEYSASLFNSESYQDKLTATLGQQFLRDLERENIFTGAYLLEALNASDYVAGLQVPQAIGDYLFDEKVIYNNPFYGAQLTFQHQQFAFDRAEVFVYPIRKTEWKDSAAISREEAENLQKELRLMEREGQLASVDLSEVQSLQWKLGTNEYSGSFYGNTLTDLQGTQASSATYIFTKGDKFIRIRAIFPTLEGSAEANRPDGFVRALLQEMALPAESPFMARLRQQQRELAADI
ncbi:hypothetical protein AWR36_008505 [Microbulbifer flavimaris]|uniref:Uncharacterized protein n=1 Tax=Microbulbifer flavimaris TaxID=1781068 RepID=A0ABX4I1W2_9GAMM|nr:hypothetical protein AWR36_008505 [Microbulbifer flavimaris]